MSIRLEVLSRKILERLNALEKKVERITIPINEISVEPEPNGQLVPKHIMFGKWGLAIRDEYANNISQAFEDRSSACWDTSKLLGIAIK